jgi:hypothetical protein
MAEHSVANGFAFISYAHSDLGYVRRLVTSLERRGAEVWFDERIPTGELWDAELRHRRGVSDQMHQ